MPYPGGQFNWSSQFNDNKMCHFISVPPRLTEDVPLLKISRAIPRLQESSQSDSIPSRVQSWQVPGHSQVPPNGLTGFTSGLHFPQQTVVWAHGTHGRDGTHSSSWVPQHAAPPKLHPCYRKVNRKPLALAHTF